MTVELVEVIQEQINCEFLWSPPLFIIRALHHTDPSPFPELCDSPDQAAHHHVFGFKLEISFLTCHVTRGSEEVEDTGNRICGDVIKSKNPVEISK